MDTKLMDSSNSTAGNEGKGKASKKKRKKGARLTYILDTNVLALSPAAVFAFDEHHVILLDIALEELDGLKKTADPETAYNAREAVRIIDSLREKGNIITGVPTPGGGTFRIEKNHVDEILPEGWEEKKADNRILRAAKAIAKARGRENTVLVTNDAVMRVKADVIGVCAEEYRTQAAPDAHEQYKGRRAIKAGADIYERYTSSNGIFADELKGAADMYENEFCEITISGKEEPVFGRYSEGAILPLAYSGYHPCGIRAKNTGQIFAIDALMSREIPLVILKGSAGTAKTFITLAVALDQAFTHNVYKKILIVRPQAEFDGQEGIGYLPGDELAKIGPLLRPAEDNIEQLAEGLHYTQVWQSIAGATYGENMTEEYFVKELFERGMIGAQAMNFMRGRSIRNTFLIVDEAQNLTQGQAIGLVTRAGLDTKIVLMGDIGQIDNPRLSARTNGLSYTGEMMKGSKLCAQVFFDEVEGVRSPLATEAAMRMAQKGGKKFV